MRLNETPSGFRDRVLNHVLSQQSGALQARYGKQGTLTDFGREQGSVAFQPSPFSGQRHENITYTLNDAQRRMKAQTAYYIAHNNGEALRGAFDGIILCCGRKAA